MKIHILCSITFLRKSHRLWDNVEKYGGNRGATNCVTIWWLRVAFWISKATRTYAHSHAHAPEYLHARTHARKHVRTHRTTSYTYCFSTATIIRERVSILRILPVLFYNQEQVTSQMKRWLCLSVCLYIPQPSVCNVINGTLCLFFYNTTTKSLSCGIALCLHIITSVHHHICTSVHHHICTSVHHHICTSRNRQFAM